MRVGTTEMLLFTLLIYAAIIYGAVQLVKHFIRYGIDYYFKKLNAQKPSPKGEGGAPAPDEGK